VCRLMVSLSSKCRIRRDKRSERHGLTELFEVGESAKGGESADQHSGQRKVALDTLHFGERLAKGINTLLGLRRYQAAFPACFELVDHR
jgi:hypothetical protein